MNRLASESSLYLQQHKDNPVDWWPWSEQALTEARDTGKPILLSIGYSACHWCHVMAHESFANDTIAAVMNRHFINIKVDREERPDIDKIYQTAHQLMAQRPGGWPLTMFLTPEAQLPFFGGTYFPPEPRQGMPGFVEVLEKVAEFHNSNPEEAARQGTAVQEVFSKLEPEQRDNAAIDAAPANLLRHVLAQQFDENNGGFGRAPKFPQTPSLLRMLNHWREGAESDEPDLQALLMAALSQTRMIHGGLFDQVGGGFFRYCVDADWQIPHFEKMLYDNGQLLSLLAATAVATGDENFVAAASATADWMLRDMRHTDGAFFATLDADSEGGEGAFYTFTPEEIENILKPEEAALALELFGLKEAANFEGRWHLVQRQSIDEAAESRGLSARGLREEVNAIRMALLSARAQRPPPGRDEKILTSWNALAIRGLTEAARATGNGAYHQAATEAATFIQTTLWRDGTLASGWQAGEPLGAGFLDDYALLADALLSLAATEFETRWLGLAVALTDAMLARFTDAQTGALFFTAEDAEALMYRARPIGDDATPAGNAVAARILTRLGFALARTDYLETAERIFLFARSAMGDYPQAHVSLVEASKDWLAPLQTLVLRGPPEELRVWQRSANALYAPHRWTLAIPNDTDGLPDALAVHSPAAAGVIAYLCDGTTCRTPITDWNDLSSALREQR